MIRPLVALALLAPLAAAQGHAVKVVVEERVSDPALGADVGDYEPVRDALREKGYHVPGPADAVEPGDVRYVLRLATTVAAGPKAQGEAACRATVSFRLMEPATNRIVLAEESVGEATAAQAREAGAAAIAKALEGVAKTLSALPAGRPGRWVRVRLQGADRARTLRLFQAMRGYAGFAEVVRTTGGPEDGEAVLFSGRTERTPEELDAGLQELAKTIDPGVVHRVVKGERRFYGSGVQVPE